MNIPPYWAKASSSATRPDGMELHLTAWGWSLADPAEAQRKASERLSRMVERVTRGEELPTRYPYGASALREQILDEIREGSEVRAVITRNGYGCAVINAPEVMFVDIDTPDPSLGQGLRRLFSRGGSPDDDAVKKITESLTSTFRIYRTAAGFRLLSVDRTWTPGSPEAEKLMTAVSADPAYVQLCKAQKTFRARVTPKPWRCDQPSAPGSHPREPQEARAFDQWLQTYEKRSSGHSVCRFLTQVGSGRLSAQVQPVLEYHDNASRAHEQLPLA